MGKKTDFARMAGDLLDGSASPAGRSWEAGAEEPRRSTAPGPSMIVQIDPLAAGLIISGFVLLRLLNVIFSPVVNDEAYYWIWSRHLSLSYCDHPPLIAWLNFVVTKVLGDSVYGLRVLPFFSIFVSLYFIRDCCRQWFVDYRGAFVVAALFFVASPMFGVATSHATPDYLLIMFTIVCLAMWSRVTRAWLDRGEVDIFSLYGAALAVGLAGLSKYNGVVLGVALLLSLLVSKTMRPLLKSVHIWVAGIIAILMQLPVVIWNATNGYESFLFHLRDRHASSYLEQVRFDTAIGFLAQVMLLSSPILLYLLFKASIGLGTAARSKFVGSAPHLNLVLAFLIFAPVALTTQALGWWVISALAGAIIATPMVLRRAWVLYLHVAFAGALSIVQVFSTSVVPITMLTGSTRNDWPIWIHGMDRLKLQVDEALRGRQVDFLAGYNWDDASLLAFASTNPEVVALGEKSNAYRQWQGPYIERSTGSTALVFVYNHRGADSMLARFDRTQLISEQDVVQLGHVTGNFQLYYAEGFSGPPEFASGP